MNKLILISGCSGSGKTTIMRSAMTNELVSFTTRKKRENEIDGVDYNFITKNEFFKLEGLGRIAEHVKYDNNYYGLTHDEINTKLNKGDAFLICDYNGMVHMKKLYPNCVTVFIYADEEIVKNRMFDRGDSDEQVSRRMRTYKEEVRNRFYYDHVIDNNGSLEQAIEDMLEIKGIRV